MATIEAPHTAANGRKTWRVIWRHQGKQQRSPRSADTRYVEALCRAITARNDAMLASDPAIKSGDLVHGPRPVETFAAKQPTTLGAWLDRELARKVEGARRQTGHAYRNRRAHLKPWDGRDVRTWGKRDSEQLVRTLGKSLAPSTVRNTHALVTLALNAAAQAGGRDEAAPRRTRVQGIGVKVGKSLTDEQAQRLIEDTAAINARAGDAALLAYGTGLRLGEVACLRADDLLVSSGILVVRVDETHDRYEDGAAGATKTENSEREVSIGPELWAMLQRRAAGIPPRGFLFRGQGKDPLRAPDVTALTLPYRTAARALTKQGVLPARVRFHDLRHTHGSRLLAAGIAPTDVAARLGHTLAQLCEVYAITSVDTHKRMAALTDARMTRKRGLRVVA